MMKRSRRVAADACGCMLDVLRKLRESADQDGSRSKNTAAHSTFQGGRIAGTDVVAGEPQSGKWRECSRSSQIGSAGEGCFALADDLVPQRLGKWSAERLFEFVME